MSESTKAVFLSYAREDTDAAKRIAEALRGFGVEVWFDQAELHGGDAWDAKIRRQIRECALFVPLVSRQTEARAEGYFRREWKIAIDRTQDMGSSRTFIVPVVIDETKETGADVPEDFMRYQWTRLPQGAPTPEFVALVKRLLEAPRKPVAQQAADRNPRPEGGPMPRKAAPMAALWISLGVVAVSVGMVFFVTGRRQSTEEAARRSAPPTSAALDPKAQTPDPVRAPATDDKSVAVLPFANLSGDKDQEYFSDGLTEEILNTLARERDLRVPGRASSFSFKGKNVSSAEIARSLNVSRLVEGSVRKSGNKVRISVSLTRAADGFSEELGTFTEEMTDIFALQDKVARAVVEKLTRRTVTSVTVGLTKNAEAYDAYLKGRALQVRAANFSLEAAKFYEQAVALDPAFALAWARLAEARFRSYAGQTDRGPEVVKGARVAIDQALAAQPDLPEALIMRANWIRSVEFDFAGAKQDLDRAEALQPAKADLRYAQAILARDLGHYAEAFRLYREALQLDPQNGDYTNAYAVSLCLPRGEYVEADQLFRRAMAIQGPGVATPFANLITLRTLWRGPEAALRLLDRMPATQAGLGQRRLNLLVGLGRLDEARTVVDQLESTAGPAESIASLANQNQLPEPALLLALEREEQARQRAKEIVAVANTEFARGNRAPQVRTAFIRAEIVLGRRDSALAALQEWREEAQRIPSDFRRVTEFTSTASALYALLGRADEAVALLREVQAIGFRSRYGIRYNQDFDAIRQDPRVEELTRQYEAWAKTLPDPVDL